MKNGLKPFTCRFRTISISSVPAANRPDVARNNGSIMIHSEEGIRSRGIEGDLSKKGN
ncbi:hypothetical protein [Neobacillus cucumis]|uniref:hypothetical protein n=1 Tax=Neobacillus cucumis TaxID=1740721 RepID=UPI002E1D4042|nr:hypothetical protein [Neobacillus cucumis]